MWARRVRSPPLRLYERPEREGEKEQGWWEDVDVE